ncbi:MAG: prolipoprotein diacylglyceryl transferase [Deltaproteobacteria bacterium]|nr:prolipoprotein diacylglyceryl transferase [Deltaproteobacteria bacterium]MCB9785769.1 prolipoprotein diacylglyceryl transferase [Deltaproteobacteria bacterium]
MPILASLSHGLLGALPYQTIPPLELGPAKFYPFGFLVGMAIIVGTMVATRRARRVGLDDAVISELALWAVIPGMIGAHLYSAIFYFPEKIADDWLYLLKFWDGISSFGGFLGGTIGVLYYLRRERLPAWPYADCIAYGFVFAWIFGRMGCTVAFDHPGSVTDFALGMPYPHTVAGDPAAAGVIRHNLGFYEMLWSVGIASFFFAVRNRPHFAGWFASVALLLYLPFRFALDFLRAIDERYFGLTPGHYAAIAFFVAAIALYRRRSAVGEIMVPDGKVHVFADGTPAVPAKLRRDAVVAAKQGQRGKAASKKP